MRAIVTGGAGFIGSTVCRHLVRDLGCSVLNIDALTYAASLESLRPIANSPSYSFLNADITDQERIQRAFAEFDPDCVLHLAAESHVDRSIAGSAAFIRTNVVGTHVMLEAARTHFAALSPERRVRFRFLHVSTDEVYGSLGPDGLFSEETIYDPSSPYSASKAAGDHFATAWWRTYGLPVVVSNCSNNYGPYHFPEKLIPLVILNAREGKRLPVYGDGRQVRDWLYVEDHARALAMIVANGRPGEKYNVGGRNERTNLEVVEAICDALDSRAKPTRPRRELIEFVADRPGHDRRYAIDASKLERELGWRAQQNFDSGIQLTVDWYLQNEWWWRPLRERYDGSRLGLLETPATAP